MDTSDPHRPPESFADDSIDANVVPESPPRPRVWTPFVVFVAAFVLQVPVIIVFLIVLTLILHGPNGAAQNLEKVIQSDIGILGSTLCTMATFAGGAILAGWASPIALVNRLRLTKPSISPFGMATAICGTLSISLAFDGLSLLDLLPDSPVLSELSRIIGSMTGFSLIGAVLTIGVAPGIAEELLFRGYIQTRLTQRWGAGVGIFVTSLLFGLMHMDPVHMAFAFFMGLFLGYLTERSGSIRPAMICHATNNIISTLTASQEVSFNTFTSGLILASACLILALSTAYLWAFVPNKNHKDSATEGPQEVS